MFVEKDITDRLEYKEKTESCSRNPLPELDTEVASNCPEEVCQVPEFPSSRYRYLPYADWDPFLEHYLYGILGQRYFQDTWITATMVSAFSRDGDAVALLAKKCTELQLSPIHILDVIHDFIT